MNMAGLSPSAREELSQRMNEADKEYKARPHRPIHVIAMRGFGFTLGYIFLGLGWVIKYSGEAIYWFGKEMKEAARSIN
jgi:hypothetical protein